MNEQLNEYKLQLNTAENEKRIAESERDMNKRLLEDKNGWCRLM